MSNKIDLSGMNLPGRNAQTKIVALPVPVAETPAPLKAPSIEQPTPARVCSTCGQHLPEKIVVEVAAVVDPNAERTDLPPRSPQEIARLIAAGESEDARTNRIWNDKQRWLHQQGRD